MAKDSIGGAGFGIKYLFDEVKAGTDVLGPDNKLISASGPFMGTGLTVRAHIGGSRQAGLRRPEKRRSCDSGTLRDAAPRVPGAGDFVEAKELAKWG